MIEDKDRAPVTLVTVTLTADDADALYRVILGEHVKGLEIQKARVFAERMRAFVARGKVGPLAVVTGPERHRRLANICQTLVTVERPMRIFTDVNDARRWLAEQAPVEDDPPEQRHATRTAAE